MAGMVSREFIVAPGDVLTLKLEHVTEFASRCPEQYAAVLECAAFVNWSRMEAGEPPIMALSLFKQ